MAAGKPLRAVVIGQPFWSRQLAIALNRVRPVRIQWRSFGVSSTNPLQAFLGLLQGNRADIVLRVGFRPGSATKNGRAFDFIWKIALSARPGPLKVFYWIGTDVWDTVRDFRANRLTKAFEVIESTFHLAGAPWLAQELKEVGIDAETALFPPMTPETVTGFEQINLPKAFEALSYVPDDRADFYGGADLVHLARAFPAVKFNILGGNGTWIDTPPQNLVFHGWQKDILPFFARSSVVLRLTKHDSFGGTATEGLFTARHLISSTPIPTAVHIEYGNTQKLEQEFALLCRKHETGKLKPNLEGQKYAREQLRPEKLAEVISKRILEFYSRNDAPCKPANRATANCL